MSPCIRLVEATLIAFCAVGSLAGAASAAAPKPCAAIVAACKSAGFFTGGKGAGTAIQKDCISPLLAGAAHPANATIALPQVDAKTIADCAAADPAFGESDTSEPGKTAAQPTASQAAVAPAPPAPAPPSQPPAKGPTPGKSVTYYVATTGTSAGDGSEAQPFASIEQARAYVRTLGIGSNARFAGVEIHIAIEPGTYELASTLLLTSEDSGTKDTPIFYEAADPTKPPMISGGVAVTGWHQLADGHWQAALPADTAYFENLWVNDVRHLRPRLGGGMVGTYNRIYKTDYDDKSGDPSCAAQASKNKAYECFDRFTYKTSGDGSDPEVLKPESWGNAVDCSSSDVNNLLSHEVEVLVFEQFSTSKLRVKCYDPKKGVLYMTSPTAVPEGSNEREAGFIEGDRIVVENIKSALTQPGQWYLDRSVKPWTLTYVAAKGENPNSETIVIPQRDQVLVATDLQYVTFRNLVFEYDNWTIPDCDAAAPGCGYKSTELEPDISSAVSFQNSQSIAIDGVTVRHTSGGGLDFTSCVKKEDGKGGELSPAWCRVFDPSAVTANITIANSIFYDVGAHGVRIGQNNHGALNSVFNDSNVPHDVSVVNSVVEGFGRVIPAAFGIGLGDGHNVTFDHDEVYDGYHVGLSMSHGDASNTDKPNGMGNANNTISNSLVHNIFKGLMNDGGSIRMEAGDDAYTAAGNRIVGNIIHDTVDASALDTGKYGRVGYGGDGIYLDNSTGAVDVEDNLIYRVSDKAVFSPHGPSGPSSPNIVRNNILAYARGGMIAVLDPYKDESGPSYQPGLAFKVDSNLMYFDLTAKDGFYAHAGCDFPGDQFTDKPTEIARPLPFDSFEEFGANLYWRRTSSGGDGGFAADKTAFRVERIVLQSSGPNPLPNPKSGHGPKPERPDKKGPDATQPAAADTSAPEIGNACSGDKKAMKSILQVTDYSLDGWRQAEDEDAGSIVKDPGFTNPTPGKDDFSLPHGSPGVGFVPFPLTAGLTKSPGTLPVVPDTFVTGTLKLTEY